MSEDEGKIMIFSMFIIMAMLVFGTFVTYSFFTRECNRPCCSELAK